MVPARELEAHRNRDEAGAHDAVVGGDKLRAIGGENADAIPAREAARRERARDAISHVVDLAKGEFARNLLAAEIDDRNLAEIAIARNEVAEIGEGWHLALRRGGEIGAAAAGE